MLASSILTYCLALISPILATTTLPAVSDSMTLATKIKNQISAKQKKYIIFFGANFCPYTNAKSPTWDKVQVKIRQELDAEANDKIEIIRFECADHPLCQAFGVYGIPAARFYSTGPDTPEVIPLSEDESELQGTLIKYLSD